MSIATLEAQYIRAVSSWESGGGIIVDIIELTDGRVLGVTDESVVLYPSIDALQDGQPTDSAGLIVLA